ncbi:uncharacterized protein A4U43_C07F19190 [Asparagus officinalis]|uniref:Dilute domain-containing protein n=1 Tax=Asparagus officinalis TaxID=4686 RepID=A0A5P1EGJ5_ASPOF|nr:uncharacterized protein A4U43_C07F19190 [Asparagus officinalis]
MANDELKILSFFQNEETNHLGYWLSNASTLLFLLHKSIKPPGSGKPPAPTSLFGRMTQSFRASPSSSNLPFDALSVIRHVEAKYPAILFKEQLAAYVDKIFGMTRENTKKEIAPLLSLCMQASRMAKADALEGSEDLSGNQGESRPWQSIIESLNKLLHTLEENFVTAALVQKMFAQIFSFINVQLFNSLLLRRECCSFGNGEYIKSGLEALELWCGQTKAENTGSSWDELKHTRQAVGFLVIFHKARVTYDDIANDLCPTLSVQQLYRICTQYWDDKYDTQSVSTDVLSNMRVLMTEEDDDAETPSFLLDDLSSMPFSIEDMTSTVPEKIFRDVPPVSELLENPAFQFLQE